MFAFIVRRLVGAVVMLVIVSMVTFGIFFQLPKLAGQTTDQLAASYVGKAPTAEAIADVKERLGLDDPIAVQYGRFVKGIFAGQDYSNGPSVDHCSAPCLGFSFRTNEPVLPTLLDRAPVTLSLGVGAAIIWLVAGVGVGILSALRRGTAVDRAAMAVALAGVSLPVYFTGLVSMSIFVYTLKVWPDGIAYVGFLDNPGQWAWNLVLPWVTLAFLYAATYARLTRSGMLETLGEDYIRTARAKGLGERTVIVRHALRASLTPIVTIFGLDLGLLLGGAVLTEQTFSLAGLGSLSIDSILSGDLPMVMGVVLLATVFIVLASLIVDILYAVVDPRVRLGS
ncbi:peptide/nickel transport system permease protein [Actinocorallia herbida]|uniref:Peptide/nickel transport system permease protein n=1 Tax=Actinocorallia herbida TaxID=58109 RepID=A0A3N1D4L5_9ACTN|nr:ABC transporter permease [Actinocorallia herbida]ROO88457.1 peptide/nickel transport system permease protein [Actinocorallia herbida]